MLCASCRCTQHVMQPLHRLSEHQMQEFQHPFVVGTIFGWKLRHWIWWVWSIFVGVSCGCGHGTWWQSEKVGAYEWVSGVMGSSAYAQSAQALHGAVQTKYSELRPLKYGHPHRGRVRPLWKVPSMLHGSGVGTGGPRALPIFWEGGLAPPILLPSCMNSVSYIIMPVLSPLLHDHSWKITNTTDPLTLLIFFNMSKYYTTRLIFFFHP